MKDNTRHNQTKIIQIHFKLGRISRNYHKKQWFYARIPDTGRKFPHINHNDVYNGILSDLPQNIFHVGTKMQQ